MLYKICLLNHIYSVILQLNQRSCWLLMHGHMLLLGPTEPKVVVVSALSIIQTVKSNLWTLQTYILSGRASMPYVLCVHWEQNNPSKCGVTVITMTISVHIKIHIIRYLFFFNIFSCLVGWLVWTIPSGFTTLACWWEWPCWWWML